MKRKVGTLLEEDVLRKAKRRAVDEGRPLSDLIQDALESYLSTRAVDPAKSDAAYQLYCERPIKLTSAKLKAVMEEDAWDL
ncbi:MAG: hypothetical protein CO150_03605 [Nitrospirae bacterium CG_4_9_14_3_um_filter_53_35]|nr:MAG: hypothetical protein AUK29_10130 [Nitrospirae bacterium CG2_30_53_67]PIS38273.1 MAG: hypothetical protein COT35_01685 [Nitrospirae bacterium CG08_land_8_20_14_0_20_52_24]PIV84612.1 MAG: hypothetical protein COW52_06650 [Nitrospirae bacterium CG17_big_fil_post_rev_8_21_14_2_50_50_9]PIW84421.1 MAG: hypothetical protein COZ95_09935 [Nitrospirae bacterium CG_4_8_14_3_um_filter_50_41]PIX85819.1 MAG: hypothetical protein COZ32_06495 [Nitrospirae bacterium CG_4_10_14_3_um_filter_53_41]PJA7625